MGALVYRGQMMISWGDVCMSVCMWCLWWGCCAQNWAQHRACRRLCSARQLLPRAHARRACWAATIAGGSAADSIPSSSEAAAASPSSASSISQALLARPPDAPVLWRRRYEGRRCLRTNVRVVRSHARFTTVWHACGRGCGDGVVRRTAVGRPTPAQPRKM